jgi:hypothetical protein
MILIHRSIKDQHRKMIRQVVKDFSRSVQTVVLILPDTEVTCPNCLYNSLDKNSTGVFNTHFIVPTVVFSGTLYERTVSPTSFNRARCPVCYGKGVLTAPVRYSIQAHSYWSPNAPTEDSNFTDLPAGREGDNFVMLKTDAENYRLIYNAVAAYINGIYTEPFRPPVIRGFGGSKSLCLAWFMAVKGKDMNSRY